MKRYQSVVYAFVFLFLHQGCSSLTGPPTYVNKQYQSRPPGAATLAIVPVIPGTSSLDASGGLMSLTKITNDLFEKSFASRIPLVPMEQSSSFFNANTELLSKIVHIKYSQRDLDNRPLLTSVLETTKLSLVRQQLDNAGLLLVPVRFDLIPDLGQTYGYSEFRLYDLRTGDLIYSVSRNMQVNRLDEQGRDLMAAILISQAAKDFKDLYLHE